jgi:hypothetical protein
VTKTYEQKNHQYNKSNDTIKVVQPVTGFDGKCAVRGEWEFMKKVGYFKRTAAYYFPDASLIHVLLVSSRDDYSELNNLNFNINLKVSDSRNESKRLLIQLPNDNVHFRIIKANNNYAVMAMDVQFNVWNSSVIPAFANNTKSIESLSRLNMRVVVEENGRFNSSTKRSLVLKVKQLFTDHAKKRGVSQCSGCIHFADSVAERQFKWWAVQSKKVGVAKVSLCDLYPGDKDSAVRKFLVANTKFFNVVPLTCIPNMFSRNVNSSLYLKSYKQIVNEKDVNELAAQLEPLDLLYQNECYLDQMDR